MAVYSNGRGRPGQSCSPPVRRCGRGREPGTGSGSAGTHLVAGRRYWLVVLPTRGKVELRYRRTRACTGADGRRPQDDEPPKAVAVARGPAGMPGVGLRERRVCGWAPERRQRPHAARLPVAPEPPGAAVPQTKNCFSTPSACGYPDQTNTGVPAGTPLTTFSGDQQINSPGTYTGWNVVNGSIRVNASNVTIRDSVVTNSGPTGNDILIPQG